LRAEKMASAREQPLERFLLEGLDLDKLFLKCLEVQLKARTVVPSTSTIQGLLQNSLKQEPFNDSEESNYTEWVVRHIFEDGLDDTLGMDWHRCLITVTIQFWKLNIIPERIQTELAEQRANARKAKNKTKEMKSWYVQGKEDGSVKPLKVRRPEIYKLAVSDQKYVTSSGVNIETLQLGNTYTKLFEGLIESALEYFMIFPNKARMEKELHNTPSALRMGVDKPEQYLKTENGPDKLFRAMKLSQRDVVSKASPFEQCWYILWHGDAQVTGDIHRKLGDGYFMDHTGKDVTTENKLDTVKQMYRAMFLKYFHRTRGGLARWTRASQYARDQKTKSKSQTTSATDADTAGPLPWSKKSRSDMKTAKARANFDRKPNSISSRQYLAHLKSSDAASRTALNTMAKAGIRVISVAGNELKTLTDEVVTNDLEEPDNWNKTASVKRTAADESPPQQSATDAQEEAVDYAQMAVRNVSQSGSQKPGSTLTDEQRLDGNRARARDFLSVCAKDESNNIDLDGMNDVINKAPHPSKLPSVKHANDPSKASDAHCKACEQTPWGQEHCDAHNMKNYQTHCTQCCALVDFIFLFGEARSRTVPKKVQAQLVSKMYVGFKARSRPWGADEAKNKEYNHRYYTWATGRRNGGGQ